MKSLRIQNLKSIKDSGNVDLKPLTILIGKNSCGKSSFLRVFPLMKQSINKTKPYSLSWNGEFVDFGSYKNALNSDCVVGESISLTFNFSVYGITRKIFTKQKFQ